MTVRQRFKWTRPDGRLLGRIAFAAYVGVNLGLVIYQPWIGAFDRDWALWTSVATSDNPYRESASGLLYVWSPLMVPIIVVAASLPIAWGVAHIAAVLIARDWLFIILMLCSWGFWTDVAGGNTFTFSVVAGLLAWRGSRPAALIYLVLMFLMPRPIQLPLAFVLLMRMPEIRMPAAIVFIAHAIVIAPYASEWIANSASYTAVSTNDLGPRRFIGDAWLPVAIVAAAALTLRGRPGWGGLFASVYWLPQYFLMPLIDVPARAPKRPTSHTCDARHLTSRVVAEPNMPE